jgi:hypothetical protein
MRSEVIELTIELEPGEKLALPEPLNVSVGAGRWLITIRSVDDEPVRVHSAFLNGYAPEDEGLYDDYSSR